MSGLPLIGVFTVRADAETLRGWATAEVFLDAANRTASCELRFAAHAQIHVAVVDVAGEPVFDAKVCGVGVGSEGTTDVSLPVGPCRVEVVSPSHPDFAADLQCAVDGRDLVVVLPLGGLLRGWVHDAHGNPIEDAQVSIASADEQMDTTTSDEGLFDARLSVGRWRVTVTGSGAVHGAQDVEIRAGGETRVEFVSGN